MCEKNKKIFTSIWLWYTIQIADEHQMKLYTVLALLDWRMIELLGSRIIRILCYFALGLLIVYFIKDPLIAIVVGIAAIAVIEGVLYKVYKKDRNTGGGR